MEAITFKVYPHNKEQIKAIETIFKALKIKFEVARDTSYNPEFTAKIERGLEDYKNGKGITIPLDELNELCK